MPGPSSICVERVASRKKMGNLYLENGQYNVQWAQSWPKKEEKRFLIRERRNVKSGVPHEKRDECDR